MGTDKRFADLGKAMKQAREASGLRQDEAAARLETNQTQLSRYESGQRQAPLTFLRKAEQLYGVPIVGTFDRSAVSRETPDGASPVVREPQSRYEADSRARYRRLLLTTAQRLSALSAELIREASAD